MPQGEKVIDARERQFFERGHIPGAINLPRSAIARELEAFRQSWRAQPIVIYCSGADCSDSRFLATRLSHERIGPVTVFPGGWEEWSAVHLPSEP